MPSFTLDDKGIALVFCYLLSLLVIGFLARRASRESSLKDYYLAGSSLGVISLFFTLYATQYSGNSLFALPGKAYRDGVMAGAFIFGVMGVVLVYQLYAKRLHQLARQHQFISVGDFVFWRYQSKALLFVVNLVLIATLVTFMLGPSLPLSRETSRRTFFSSLYRVRPGNVVRRERARPPMTSPSTVASPRATRLAASPLATTPTRMANRRSRPPSMKRPCGATKSASRANCGTTGCA